MKRILFATLFLTGLIHAEDPQRFFAPPDTEYAQLSSQETGHDYQLLIKLPSSYSVSNEKYYPSVYILDAQWDFALIASMVEKLVYDSSIPESILVGISYAGEQPDYAQLRERDFTPTKVASVNPFSGGAPGFLRFIRQRLIPYIEASYRADPQNRVLGGTSYGGLFSLYALYQDPNLFGRHIANSPSVYWDEGELFRMDARFAEKRFPLPARLSITHGADEYSKFKDVFAEFQKILSDRSYEDLHMLEWITEDARHAGAGIEGWRRGLIWTFSDLTPQEPGPLERLYRSRDRPITIRLHD